MSMILVNDEACTFEHEGNEFTAGGAIIGYCKDKKYHGRIYIVKDKQTGKMIASTWHGEKIANLDTLTDYRGNFCKMRRISFTLNGIKFIGDYCPDWAECVNIRSTKRYDYPKN